ncbi:hypothetical protein EGR_02944 [Echinococcus granulosus]|uniref:Uncharacterized protein n=1 Tax=Echinococcus granulosus TaxID=6210 RepID=W6UUZ5_ECHGR|nr:hypothetical protein EGR_02944 [Echinococcus granulosus]EUB62192.1 hypothetical protein EGR_02944 [Echinococcus granulosus]
MFSPPDLGVLAAAFHPNGLSNTNNTSANGRFPQTANSDEADGNNFNNGFCSRQSAFSSPEKGILSPRQNSYVGVTDASRRESSAVSHTTGRTFVAMLAEPVTRLGGSLTKKSNCRVRECTYTQTLLNLPYSITHPPSCTQYASVDLLSLDDINTTTDNGGPMMSTRSSPSTSSTTSPPNASQPAPRFPPSANSANANAAAVLAAAAVAASRYSPTASAATPSSLQDAAAVFSAAYAATSSAEFGPTVASPAAVAMAAAAAAAAVAAYPPDSGSSIMSVPSPIFPPPPMSNGNHQQQRLSPSPSQPSGSSGGEGTCKPDFANASDFFEAFARSAGGNVGGWRGQLTPRPERRGIPSTEALLECYRAQLP